MNITLVQSKNSILYVYLVKKVEEMCTNMILSLWLLKVAIFSGIKCYWSFINWSGVFIFIKLQNLNEVNMITISGGLLKKSWEVDFFFKKFSFMLHLYMSWWAFWLIFCFFLFFLLFQTLIYFYDPIDVEQDQLIEGSATLTQSKENRRFMNINLRYSWVSSHLS